MWMDFGLASVHHILVLVLAGVLCGEAVLMRMPVSPDVVRRLGRLDMLYGLSSVALVAAGVARVFLGAKGAGYYAHNTMFWVKMGVFVAIGLASALPTVRILRWNRALAATGALPTDAEWGATRKVVFLEVHALTGVLVAAAALARGIGY